MLYYDAFDHDDVALASCCEPIPANLHVFYSENEKDAVQLAGNTNVINLSGIIV